MKLGDAALRGVGPESRCAARSATMPRPGGRSATMPKPGSPSAKMLKPGGRSATMPKPGSPSATMPKPGGQCAIPLIPIDGVAPTKFRINLLLLQRVASVSVWRYCVIMNVKTEMMWNRNWSSQSKILVGWRVSVWGKINVWKNKRFNYDWMLKEH